MKLNPKQKLFADKYIECRNATESALYAGYSEKTARNIGCENLTKPYIKEYIDKRLDKKSEKLDLSFETIAKALWTNHNLALEQVKMDGTKDIKASSDALKEINKMMGHNAVIKTETKVELIDSMSDDDLEKQIAKMR